MPRSKSTILAITASILVAVGCARPPSHLPVCSAENSPNAFCGMMNPEDLGHLPGGEWIVVSQMAPTENIVTSNESLSRPGNLVAIRLSDGDRRTIFPLESNWDLDSAPSERPSEGWGDPQCPGAPAVDQFQPHGIDLGQHGSGVPMLAVINHGGREAVELFEIEVRDRPSVVWRGCVEMPEDVMANDLALFDDGGFVVTKFMPRFDGMGIRAYWTMFKVGVGWNSGAVYRWHPGGEVELIAGSEGSAPNGVAISRDESEIYVAQWGASNLYRVPLSSERESDTGRPEEGRPFEVELEHHPDNLTWTEDGRLLVASQGGSASEVGRACSGIEKGGCGIDYGVYSIDPEAMSASLLFTGKGAASVALEAGDDTLVGCFTGDQIERVWTPR